MKILRFDCPEKKWIGWKMKRVSSIIHVFIVFCFSIIILYLSLLAGFSTSMMNSEEHTYLVHDSIVKNIIVLLLFISLFLGIYRLFLIKQHKNTLSPSIQNDGMRKICYILLFTVGIIAGLFVISTQRIPRSDQSIIQEVVNQWIDRNYSCFNRGGYLDQYPNQAGIIIVCYFLSFIVGANNYIAFQFANVIALTIVYKEFGDIVEKKTGRIEYRLTIYIFGLFFIPGIMYTGFIYGNIIGLALSLVSFKHTLLFIDKQKIKNGCIAIIAISLAVIIKQNYLIFGVALAIYLLIELINKYQGKLITLFVIIVLALASTGIITNEIVFNITGFRMNKGLSKWSWVTMGMMENKQLYDGWWNQYNSGSYAEANYDTEKQAEKNKTDLKDRLRLFKNDPKYAIKFFSGKNASQWNNPGFQSVWVNQIMFNSTVMRQPPWVNYLINDNGTGLVSQFSNYYHFILLVGVLLHVLQCGVKKNPYELFFLLAFIGGFILHTIWEAKGQYTISYFWLLLPLSAEGYVETTEKIYSLSNKKIVFKKPSARTIIQIGFALAFVVLLSFNTSFLRDVFLRDEDTISFSEYVSTNKTYMIYEGNYLFHPKQDPSLSLSVSPSEKGPSTALVFKHEGTQDDDIYIHNSLFEDCQIIGFGETDYVLDVSSNENKVGIEIWGHTKNSTIAPHWEFKRKNGNEYVIYHNGLVLAYNIEDNKVYLDNYNDSEQQKWIIDASIIKE